MVLEGRARADAPRPLPCARACVQGKLYTEDLLQKRGVNWTSVRPVYIYGQ